MAFKLSKLTVNEVTISGSSARVTVKGKTDIVAEYVPEATKMVKVTNETGANMIAVKITLSLTSISISDGASVEIPFDAAMGDIEIKLKPAA